MQSLGDYCSEDNNAPPRGAAPSTAAVRAAAALLLLPCAAVGFGVALALTFCGFALAAAGATVLNRAPKSA